MAYVVVSIVALVASGLTLFSGFGLGTVLLPAFLLFFPVPIAVAATAVVHLASNLSKVGLIGRHTDLGVLILFAVPAAVCAVLGALLLATIASWQALTTWHWHGHEYTITATKVVVAGVMLGFGVSELMPGFGKFQVSRKLLPVGGALAGFFGGLSGHQGGLRTAFLVRSGLEKTAFIATAAAAAAVVDLCRLAVYGLTFFAKDFRTLYASGEWTLIIAGCAAAFVGAFIGTRMMKKVTFGAVRVLLAIFLIGTALALGSGLI